MSQKYSIIRPKDYTPQYDLSSVVPFVYKKTLKGHTNLVDFAKLVKKNELGKIAYWFDRCNKNDSNFKISFDGLQEYEYTYDEFFLNAIEIAMQKKNTNFINFLLFDPINKYSKCLLNNKFLDDYELNYSYCNRDFLLFMSKQGIIGGLYYSEHEIFAQKNQSELFLKELITHFIEHKNNTGLKNLKLTFKEYEPNLLKLTNEIEQHIRIVQEKEKLNSVVKVVNRASRPPSTFKI